VPANGDRRGDAGAAVKENLNGPPVGLVNEAIFLWKSSRRAQPVEGAFWQSEVVPQLLIGHEPRHGLQTDDHGELCARPAKLAHRVDISQGDVEAVSDRFDGELPALHGTAQAAFAHAAIGEGDACRNRQPKRRIGANRRTIKISFGDHPEASFSNSGQAMSAQTMRSSTRINAAESVGDPCSWRYLNGGAGFRHIKKSGDFRGRSNQIAQNRNNIGR
jgi:hypothetical protein